MLATKMQSNRQSTLRKALMAPRLFTLDEALVLLPTVRQLISEIQAAKAEMDRQTTELERLMGLTGGNGHLAADIASSREQLQSTATRLQSLIEELDGIGVELKGIDEGLVDFPSERDGRVINLCWRMGEDTIAWWHELDTGFAGRQPL
jgi:hypothetical protein